MGPTPAAATSGSYDLEELSPPRHGIVKTYNPIPPPPCRFNYQKMFLTQGEISWQLSREHSRRHGLVPRWGHTAGLKPVDPG